MRVDAGRCGQKAAYRQLTGSVLAFYWELIGSVCVLAGRNLPTMAIGRGASKAAGYTMEACTYVAFSHAVDTMEQSRGSGRLLSLVAGDSSGSGCARPVCAPQQVWWTVAARVGAVHHMLFAQGCVRGLRRRRLFQLRALLDLLVSRMLGCDAGLQVSGVGPSPRFGIDDHLFWMPQKDALPTAADGA